MKRCKDWEIVGPRDSLIRKAMREALFAAKATGSEIDDVIRELSRKFPPLGVLLTQYAIRGRLPLSTDTSWR